MKPGVQPAVVVEVAGQRAVGSRPRRPGSAAAPTQKYGSAEVTTKTGGSDRVEQPAAPPAGDDADQRAEQRTPGWWRCRPGRASTAAPADRSWSPARRGVRADRHAPVPGDHVASGTRGTARTTFSFGLNPNDGQHLSAAPAGRRAVVGRSRSASSGLPGMNRGMKKFSVSAAQRVSTKNPSRRSRYRTTTSSSCSLSRVRFLYFWADLEYRCSQHLPDVGHVVRAPAGRRGRPASASPAMSVVLYWNQSTDSVVGMIGTSLSMRRGDLLDRST